MPEWGKIVVASVGGWVAILDRWPGGWVHCTAPETLVALVVFSAHYRCRGPRRVGH